MSRLIAIFAVLLPPFLLSIASAAPADPAPQPPAPAPPAAALTHAIDSMKSALLNATVSSPSPHPSPPGSGQIALEAARAAAAAGVPAGSGDAPPAQLLSDSAQAAAAMPEENLPRSDSAASDSIDAAAASAAAVKCDDGTCQPLVNALIAAVEDDGCRGLYSTGKCPAACAAAIATVTANSTWPACELACREDVVSAGVARWAVLCGARAETLIDQGKEAMKTLVGDSLSGGLSFRTFLQFIIGVAILAMGVSCGYRRGAVAAQMAYRLQRRRLGRKNSDANIQV